MERRVVVTGMGVVTPVGNNVNEFWESIKNGKHGIAPITHFDTSDSKVKIAAELKNFEPEKVLDKKEIRRLEQFSIYALYAAQEAVDNSGLDLDKIDPYRFGTIIGSGMGGIGMIEDQMIKMVDKGPSRLAPLFIPSVISNIASGHVAIRFGAKSSCETVVTACATSTSCIGMAYRNIKFGYEDVILAGGTESTITKAGIGGFAALKALSTSEDVDRASIPFDKERNGFVMGEGAGVLVLEELEHAKARGAKILAEIVGYGATCDAYHMTAPCEDGDGAARAMIKAMEEGNVNPNDITYINAHGTSTPANDVGETKAIKTALKENAYNVSISSTKSMTGHLLGATGAVEAIASILALENNFVPPTIGYKVKDEECDLDYTPNVGKAREMKYALSNTLGFGGHNAVLCLKKWED
ncbi:beta-ketoacyl-ACP synthase II [[Clostridium] colinum]|uniref:beta-ketoacyl-ACP synthase II n=1 Tax=[Clostridium] colinum TaxID=36835 RepID=UPI00202462CF|nr:beta-ketoacyl-ACP synthase II [[Clostridium] colinum]